MTDQELSKWIAEKLNMTCADQPEPDLINDPQMTVMLFKRLIADFDYAQACDMVRNTDAAISKGTVAGWQRAVAEAFAKAHGLGFNPDPRSEKENT